MVSSFLGITEHFLHKIHKDETMGGRGVITPPMLFRKTSISIFLWVYQFYIFRLEFYIPISIAPTEEFGLM